MKVGEIKLEALSVMNILTDIRPDAEYYDSYLADNKYKKYLMNMDESIKRAVDIISSNNVLEEKSVMVTELDYTAKTNYVILSLNQINDYRTIKKVVHIGDKLTSVKFDVVARKLIIYSDDVANLLVVYFPRVILPDNFNKDTVIDLPDYLARIIPYYIKYDLYQEDEPNLATLAKNQFYTILDSYSIYTPGDETLIENLYEM